MTTIIHALEAHETENKEITMANLSDGHGHWAHEIMNNHVSCAIMTMCTMDEYILFGMFLIWEEYSSLETIKERGLSKNARLKHDWKERED